MLAIQILKTKYKLPFDEIVNVETGERFTSLLKIMQQVREYEMTDAQYNDAIRELIGNATLPDETEPYKAKTIFGYLIQELIKEYKGGMQKSVSELYTMAVVKANLYMRENHWVFVTKDTVPVNGVTPPPKLDAAGNVAPKKGAKKTLARQVWDQNQENPDLWKTENGKRTPIRQKWIPFLIEKVGLTEGGASTYFQNLKTGVY